jgi:hypothetical protein
MNTVINNVIIIREGGISVNRKSKYVKVNILRNYVNSDVNSCRFINYNAGDFHLQSWSPLINAGTNVLLNGVDMDYYGTARPAGGAFDVGATEY